MKVKKKSIFNGISITLIIIGFLFRIISLSKNLSFWNDENHVSYFARQWLTSGNPRSSFGTTTGLYQIALYGITSISFWLLGISEFAGRLPSAIASVLLTILLYYFTKRKLGEKQGLVVAVLSSFLQIQLAWSAQLRPYIWIQLLTFSVLYFLYRYLNESHKIIDPNIIWSLVLLTFATLFHGTALLNLPIIVSVMIYKSIREKDYRSLITLPLFVVLFSLLVYYSFPGNLEIIIYHISTFYLSTLHYRVFITHNYLWLIMCASVGFFALYKRNRELALLLGGSIVFIFAIAIFKINPNYVRYSLPAFPLLYILFAEGVVSIIDKVSKKEYLRWTLVILTFIFLSFTGKFSFWPQYYYSINADVRENPIVDYKLAFAKIQTLIKDKKEVIIMDAWNDRVPWYLPGQEYIFLIKNGAGKTDPVFGEKMIGTIAEFEVEKKSFLSGVVIVEDWQSQTPEDLKEHIRKNLKFEFMVQDLPYNGNDHWGISVYSWGI
jgi:4-amino-4-deoxy-L-arabinose transferase-like glycosyltransferase